MTRTAQSLQVDDLSAFARDLHRQLAAEATTPSHLSLLNMLARAGGYQNFQHLKSQTAAATRIAEPAPPAPDMKKVEAALRYFNAAGQMTSWPAKTNLQNLCLWALWARLPAAQRLSERQVSQLLDGMHLFGDAAILRRTLVELGLVERSPGASEYLRREQPPPAEARALIRTLTARTG